ncbi:MAG: DUF6491 family protein [Pseudohongiella sp.]|uniref:DUF6491 family protein n=1 Tax=Pseudohongiella sp. TaxID=1979412 RepID=UPI0034A01358
MLNTGTLLHRLALAAAVPLALAACASSESGTSAAIMNGMQGEETRSICFNRNIQSWHDFDNDSIIVETSGDEYYRLALAGGCNTRNAFMQIAVESRGGSCLTTGDRITFDRDLGLSCSVTQIHRWHLADMAE